MNFIYHVKSLCNFCRVVLLLVTAYLNITIYANNNYEPTNAQAAGLSGTIGTQIGLWSVYGNQAGLTGINGMSIGVHCENYYSIAELNRSAIVLAAPYHKNYFGGGYSFFGNSSYNQSKLSAVYSRKLLERFSFGFSIDYYMFRSGGELEELNSASAQLGIMIVPIKNLNIGTHFYNITGEILTPELSGNLPQYGLLGISYKIEGFGLLTDIKMGGAKKPEFSAGSEIQLVKSILLRIGISNTDYASYSAGLGFRFKYINADIAFSRHPYLGFSPFVSISYSFRRND